MNEPKEHPILFSPPMVRAILAGAKTETRRVGRVKAQPGDVLWVREKFWSNMPKGKIIWAADIPGMMPMDDGRWVPSIHMPKEYCRIQLAVQSVAQEPLQSITEAGATAEGFKDLAGFRLLWDKLNGTRGFGWDANPTVTVVKFKRISGVV